MALSKPVGAAAAATGILSGAVAIVAAVTQPDVAQCVTTVFSALGSHGAAIGVGIAGALSAIAPVVAWFSHAPIPLTPQQQVSDDVKVALKQGAP